MKILIAGAAAVLIGMALIGKPASAPEPEPIDYAAIDAAAQRRAARVAAKKAEADALAAKVAPALAHLEAGGVNRDELVSYFTKEILDDVDLDDFCSDYAKDRN